MADKLVIETVHALCYNGRIRQILEKSELSHEVITFMMAAIKEKLNRTLGKSRKE